MEDVSPEMPVWTSECQKSLLPHPHTTHTHTLGATLTAQRSAHWPCKQAVQHFTAGQLWSGGSSPRSNQKSHFHLVFVYTSCLIFVSLQWFPLSACCSLSTGVQFHFLLSVEAIRRTSDYAITCFFEALYKRAWTGCDGDLLRPGHCTVIVPPCVSILY